MAKKEKVFDGNKDISFEEYMHANKKKNKVRNITKAKAKRKIKE